MRGVAQFTVYISKSQVKRVCKCLLLNLFYAVNVYIGGIRWLIFLFCNLSVVFLQNMRRLQISNSIICFKSFCMRKEIVLCYG